MNISHSKTDVYQLCPAKYKFQYVDKLGLNVTSSSLLFGSAIDVSLNYILTCKKDGLVVDRSKAKEIFQDGMDAWYNQNELVFFKSEIPPGCEFQNEELQWAVWNNLVSVGLRMVDTYIDDILPMFKRIVDVQIKRDIKNEEGDSLKLVVDFVAELHDGTIVTIDNKTTSSIKNNYRKNCVKKSQQLSIYSEYEQNRNAAYLVLQKVLENGNIVWKFIQDVIPEETIEKSFNTVDESIRGIKNEEFPKNNKACFSFGRRCEYWNACKKGDYVGLISKG